MRYIEQLRLAVSWLNSARNRDGGWGLNPGQASSIVNTAEALYVLSKAQKLPSDVEKSITYLRFALSDHPVSRGQFIRYFSFGILGLLAAGVPRTDHLVQECAEILRQSQVNSKGWSQVLKNQPPAVFPSFLALWALQMIEEQPSQQTINGLNWLLAIQKEDGGWGFTDDPREKSNAVCTAYALIVLRRLHATDQRVQRGKQWLTHHASSWLENPIVGESIGGTDWYHCSPIWASIALLELGEPVLSSPIRGVIAYLQKLFDTQIGGWRQSSQHVVNVRSIFWAVLALEPIRDGFDINDIAEAQLFTVRDKEAPSVSIAIKGFRLLIPKAIFAPLILGISGVCVLWYAAVSTQPHWIAIIDVLTVKIITTLVLIFSSILLLLKWKDVVKNLSLIW